MMNPNSEILLHPVRLKIIQCLVDGNQLTAQQLKQQLPDISQATLYRHIKVLEVAGAIVTVETRKKRGATERVFMLPEHVETLSLLQLQQGSPEAHLSYFIKFVAHLIGDFSKYVHGPDMNLLRDGVTYRQEPIFLSDEENRELMLQIRNLIQKYANNEPSENRRRRLVTTAVFPEG